MNYSLVLMLTLASAALAAQTVTGKWKTIDDKSGKARSVVDIYMKEGKLYGRIVDMFLLPGETMDAKCDQCEDDRKGEPILGMEIIRGMQQDGDQWVDGTILDPESGDTYGCKIWLDDDNSDLLKVRGYLYLFYRTQTWLRVR